jgi:ferric-dicitrate binding protein FerR (iron transport regulator)
MNRNDSQHELLLRHIDGRLTPEERLRVAALLHTGPAAREFLREVAEQAVMVADLERIAAGRAEALHPHASRLADQGRKIVPVSFRAWQWRAAAAAVIAFLAVAAFQFLPTTRPGMVRVTKVTGSSQYFGSNGRIENALTTGTSLGAGDTLETRSCDAWIELKLREGSTITIAGHSTLRLLDGEAGGKRFELSQGSLWANPAAGVTVEPVLIQTPTMAVEVRGAQFDIRTSPTESIVRVNQGSARVSNNLDGSAVTVAEGQQVAASLGRKEPLAVTAQPAPINSWACDLGRVPEVILGRWLPPTATERARLGADPLLWPISEHDSLMLYAVALAAWKSSEHPVVLHSDSKLRFRGRTERAQTVRFGFSTQQIRGVFAGKFEVDIPPASLGRAGETWEVELPLANFRPLHPQLAASPEGLELTDVYALTIQEDAGLEINNIELVPANRSNERLMK